MNSNKNVKMARNAVLTAILLFMVYKSYMHNALGGGSDGSPSVHALCPYGGLESLYMFITSGNTVSKIFTGTILLLILTVVIAILFRRAFCGFICPFGALQEFFAFIGRKTFKKKFTVSASIDRPLRYLKYLVLILTAAFAWKTGELWMSPYDPWAAFAHMFEGPAALFEEFPVGSALLLLTVAGSFLYDRFFCKYLCPMGAFLSLVSIVSPSKIERDENICISCGICAKTCPANIQVDKLKSVKSPECISCQKCVLSCPKEGALKSKFAKRNLQPTIMLSVVLVLFFGGIGLGNALGYVQFLPKPISENETILIDDIKGYMTLEEVSKYIDMPIEEIYEKLGLDSSVPSDTRFKDLSNYNPELDTDKAKKLLEAE